MKCREVWAYDIKNDKVLETCKTVQVAMVRGLSGNWKQPIFYNYNYKMTNEILLSIISELFTIGFAVVTTVSD